MKHRNKGIGLNDLVEGFLFSLQAEGRSPRTYEYYDKLFRHLLGYSREQRWPLNINQLDTRNFRQFLAWISTRSVTYTPGHGSLRTTKPKSSHAWPYYKAIKRLFSRGIQERLIDDNLVRDIHFKAPPPPPIQPYTLDELNRFLAICEYDMKNRSSFIGLRNKAILLLFLDSGLRLNEMAKIQLSDIDLDEKLVRVPGKGSKIGICPFSARTARVIWLYLLERKERSKCNALWVTEEGNQLAQEGIGSWFTALKRKAGVTSPGGVHRLRHTSALQYLRGTRDSFLLQLFLRHEDLAMSRRYTQGLKQEEAIEAHRKGASPVESLGLG